MDANIPIGNDRPGKEAPRDRKHMWSQTLGRLMSNEAAETVFLGVGNILGCLIVQRCRQSSIIFRHISSVTAPQLLSTSPMIPLQWDHHYIDRQPASPPPLS